MSSAERKRILFFISSYRESDQHRYDRLYDAAREFGWSIKIVECRFGRVRVAELIDFWKPEGVIVDCGSGADDLNETTLGNLPTVYFNTKQGLHGRGSYVYSDETAIGNLAARHLLETEYENYSFVSFRLPRYWNVDRMKVFEAAVRKSGRRFLKPFETHHEISPTRRQKRLSDWLVRLPRPCALLAANDFVGEEVLDMCLAHNLRVPEDVAVLGVDDEPYVCEHTTPSLSSIRRDNGELFSAVARQMKRLLDSGGRPCDAIVLKPDAISIRQSSRVLPTGAHAGLLPCLEFIRCQACNGIGVPEVVREIGLPRRTVEDLFRKFVGHSIFEEIERVRFEKVFGLLAQGCVRLDALADFAGYNTVIAFRKAFHRRTGLSVREWLRK